MERYEDRMMEMIGEDAVEHLLSFLPMKDLVASSLVCHKWCSIVSSSKLIRERKITMNKSNPWLFMVLSLSASKPTKKTRFMGFDPETCNWFMLDIRMPEEQNAQIKVQVAHGMPGFLYYFAGGHMHYSFAKVNNTKQRWQTTPPMRQWRDEPLVCHVNGQSSDVVLVAGGVSMLEDDVEHAAVELYDVEAGTWETCDPVPDALTKCLSMRGLCAAVYEDTDKVLFMERNSHEVMCCWFDVIQRRWEDPFSMGNNRARQMRGVALCPRPGGILLIGFGEMVVSVWKLGDNNTRTKLGEMPTDIMETVMGVEDGCDEFWYSIECVGSGDVMYFHSPRSECVGVCRAGAKGHLEWDIVAVPASSCSAVSRKLFCSPVSIEDALRV